MKRAALVLALVACSPAANVAPPRPEPLPSAVSSASQVAAVAPAASASTPAGPGVCLGPKASVEVVVDSPGAKAFTADADDLFWSDGHAIWRRPTAGGEPVQVVKDASPASEVKRLVVDGAQVWLVAAKDFDRGCIGLIGFVPRAGGTVTKVGPAGCAEDLALSKDDVAFVLRSTDPGGGHLLGNLYSAKREKGAKSLVLKRGFNGSSHVASDGAFAYFAAEIGGLDRIALGDGPTTRLTDGRFENVIDKVDGQRFEVDATHIYFLHGHLNLNGLRLHRMPKDGSEKPKLLGRALPVTPRGEGYPRGPMLVSSTHVYWSSPGEGKVLRVDKTGRCGVEIIAAERSSPDFLALTSTHVYWLESEGDKQRVVRLAL